MVLRFSTDSQERLRSWRTSINSYYSRHGDGACELSNMLRMNLRRKCALMKTLFGIGDGSRPTIGGSFCTTAANITRHKTPCLA